MQKIIHGISAESLRSLLEEYGVKKFMLVRDPAFRFLSIKDVFDCGVPCVPFDGFSSNPVYEDVEVGVKLFLSEGCDGIVAVGGGSSLDVAKCIKLYSGMDGTKCYVGQPYPESCDIPLIAVPTTAGTGSESTRHAVIYYKGVKQSVGTPVIVPDVAVLEPGVLATLPVYQKKCTMLDALSQGIESYWSVNSTEESRGYSEKAISLICKNMDAYVNDNDPDAAAAVMLGANYSGRAISITATTAAHAMSYKLSSLYGLPHGHAVAVCLPHVWKFILANTAKCTDPRGEGHLCSMLSQIASAMGTGSAYEAEEKFESIIAALGIEGPELKDAGDIDTLTASVNPERLKNNPVQPDSATLADMYSKIVGK